MPDYAFSTFTFLGILLCAAPAYFNWKIPGRPWATLILIGWIFFGNLVSFIDSVVWSDPDPNEWWDGQGYCDIAARIKASYNIGIPAAAIGICRFLADATDPDPSHKDMKHSRTRRNFIDVFLGIGLPVINMPLRWIAQPYRYYILGVMGCENGLDYTWPAIPLYLLWSPVLTLVAAVYAGIFLRHWWVRRKRLNESWALGMRNGISQTEFRRLVVTVMCVIFLYFPLSLYFLVVNLRIVLQAQQPFSWSVDHGPQSSLIIKLPHETADLISWVAPVLAITSFFFIGTTRNARQFYQRCVERVYDHLPSKLQSKLSAMQRISEASKERRLAQSSLTAGEGRSNVSMVERYHPPKQSSKDSKPNLFHGRKIKNWFDSDDDDADDSKSMHSSEATITGDEEMGGARHSPLHHKSSTTEVSAGTGVGSDWAHGVSVTRDVVVETSPR